MMDLCPSPGVKVRECCDINVALLIIFTALARQFDTWLPAERVSTKRTKLRWACTGEEREEKGRGIRVKGFLLPVGANILMHFAGRTDKRHCLSRRDRGHLA